MVQVVFFFFKLDDVLSTRHYFNDFILSLASMEAQDGFLDVNSILT